MSDLRLVDMPMPVCRALVDGDVDRAEALLDLPLPPELASHTDIWSYMMTLLTDRPSNAGWTMHALALGDVIVGNAGFKGAPDDVGEVEVGYGIETGERRKGYAVGAVHLLLDRASREPSVSSVRAVIDPDNAASVAVVTKAGFRPDGDRLHERWGRQLVFRRQPPARQCHTGRMVTWADVVAHAVTLPEVEESTSYNTPSLKVAGKLMARLRTEDDGGLAIKCSATDKEALVANDDPAFYTIPHYDGYRYILVDLARAERDEVFELIDDAWQIAAPPKVHKEHSA